MEITENIENQENKSTILGIEVTDEEWNYLFSEQSKGKALKVIDEKVVAVDREVTEEDKVFARRIEICQRLEELSQDFIQEFLGAVFDDIEERKQEFQKLHNELRTLLGKESREYIKKGENL